LKIHYKQLNEDLEKCYILPISDIHYGTPYCDINKLERYLDWALKREDVWFLLNGDLIDCATISSVGDVYGQKYNPQEQLDFILQFLAPFKDRIIAMTTGNHEHRVYRDTGIDISKIISDTLEIPYEPEGIVLKIHIGKDRNRKSRQVPYLIYMTHGWSNARTSGAKLNTLESLSNIVVNADIYISSHTHKLMTTPDLIYYIDDKNNKVIEKKRYYVNSGSYQVYGGYAQFKGYRPVKLGTARIRLDGKRKDVHISI